MRELKFRAWDKRTKKLIQIQGFKYVGEKHIQLFYFDTDGCSTTCTCEKEFIVLIQYTGLKEKNGTEIYEGDIVIFNHIKDEYPEVENIFFHNVNRTEYQKKYVAEFCNTYYRYGLRFRNGSTHFMVVQATITNHNVEVIGNIYENPELLEGRE